VTSSWFGLSGPARLPAPVVERLSREVRDILATASVRTRFAEIGGTAGTFSPADFTAFIASELAAWAPLVRESGAQPD
jgi:tripartite-type tricarboxylate transporter receptor subunit TctC